ncbi:MAG: transposase [Actinomycetota bacterium]|nr:transposase [Actinomycetota bacterium]MDQ2981907.1 transposase [Actinomycetota bacterium]
MTDLEALVVAAYVFADEYRVPARPGPPAKINDPELVALAVCQAAMGISSDRQFLGLVEYRLPGWFPHLPEQSQYNRRLRSLTGLLTVVQQRLARLLDAGGARLADGTLIGVANYAGCAAKSEFAGTAAYGYCASKSEWVWGVRLVLRTDRRGLPLAYTLVPANEHEYEPLLDLVEQGETVIADKGLWGRAYNQKMECAEVRLLTPSRVRTADNATRERTLAGLRLTIESTFANLKEQMRLERHLPRPHAASPNESRSGSSRSHSASSSTHCTDDPPAPSPPTTAADSHQASSCPAHTRCERLREHPGLL